MGRPKGSGKKKDKNAKEPPGLDFSPYVSGCHNLRPRRRMNVLEKMVKASREGRGHAALQMLLFYLDNPRLVGSEELDPESAARLIEEFVLPLACKTREERDSVRKRIKDILRE